MKASTRSAHGLTPLLPATPCLPSARTPRPATLPQGSHQAPRGWEQAPGASTHPGLLAPSRGPEAGWRTSSPGLSGPKQTRRPTQGPAFPKAKDTAEHHTKVTLIQPGQNRCPDFCTRALPGGDVPATVGGVAGPPPSLRTERALSQAARLQPCRDWDWIILQGTGPRASPATHQQDLLPAPTL